MLALIAASCIPMSVVSGCCVFFFQNEGADDIRHVKLTWNGLEVQSSRQCCCVVTRKLRPKKSGSTRSQREVVIGGGDKRIHGRRTRCPSDRQVSEYIRRHVYRVDRVNKYYYYYITPQRYGTVNRALKMATSEATSDTVFSVLLTKILVIDNARDLFEPSVWVNAPMMMHLLDFCSLWFYG